MKKRMLKVGVSLLILSSILLFYFSPALFQEGNPVPILASIVKLKYSDEVSIQFAETVAHTRYISKNNGTDRYDVVIETLDARGWTYKEQLGSGLIFEQGEERLTIETRLF